MLVEADQEHSYLLYQAQPVRDKITPRACRVERKKAVYKVYGFTLRGVREAPLTTHKAHTLARFASAITSCYSAYNKLFKSQQICSQASSTLVK